MSQRTPHTQWLGSRSKHRFIAIAMVALLAWMLEIATHSHINDAAAANPIQSVHCQLCGGFQAGAGPVAAIPEIQWLVEAAPPPAVPDVPLSANTTSSYRSRAPPCA